MKQYLTAVIFSFLINVSFSQAYHPIIELDKYWDEGFPCFMGCYLGAGRYEFTEDEVTINGYTYRVSNTYILNGQPGPPGCECPTFIADTVKYQFTSMREDTIERKVYIRDLSYDSTDVLLYDFSLTPGDTLQSSYAGQGSTLVLDQIVPVTLLNGEIRDMYCFDPSCIIGYIEGVGGLLGLFEPLVPPIGLGNELLCVKHNGTNLWGTICNTYFVGNVKLSEPKILLSPNPFREFVNIDMTNIKCPVSFDLFDVNGIKVYTTKIYQVKTKVILSHLKAGFYIYHIGERSSFHQGKLVKL